MKKIMVTAIAVYAVFALTACASGGMGGTSASERPVMPEMVLVEGGTFQMGNDFDWSLLNFSNYISYSGENPAHTVTVKSFYMGKHEVTQKEWYEVMGTTVRQQRDMADKSWPLAGEGDNYPMYYVSWYEAIEYCNKRSIKEGLTPAYRGSGNSITCNWNTNGYRLPTEAEWEYAAKDGNRDPMVYEYSGSNNVDTVAWYRDNSGGSTQPVGRKAPNSLGLYDMSGNVYEWCWDWHDFYPSEAQTNPVGASSGSYRLTRGGSWNDTAQSVRSANRGGTIPTIRDNGLGFRVVRNAP